MTEDDFSKILYSSPHVISAYVRKTEDGLAVNDYNFPLTFYPGGRGIIFPVTEMVSMFADLVSLFGSGGEMILYRVGYAIGRKGTEQLSRLFGEENRLVAAGAYTKLVDALGWGRMEVLDMDRNMPGYTVRVCDSFECAGRRARKPTGHFLRGMIAGSAERLIKKPVTCVEVECMATGSKCCLYQLEIENPTSVEQ
jgi:predicted hydrocarbon binding protein